MELKQTGKKKINLTDKDGQFQQGRGGKTLGYRAQLAGDSQRRVIVACDVTEGQNDAPYLLPMVEQGVENVEVVQADGGGASGALFEIYL